MRKHAPRLLKFDRATSMLRVNVFKLYGISR